MRLEGLGRGRALPGEPYPPLSRERAQVRGKRVEFFTPGACAPRPPARRILTVAQPRRSRSGAVRWAIESAGGGQEMSRKIRIVTASHPIGALHVFATFRKDDASRSAKSADKLPRRPLPGKPPSTRGRRIEQSQGGSRSAVGLRAGRGPFLFSVSCATPRPAILLPLFLWLPAPLWPGRGVVRFGSSGLR